MKNLLLLLFVASSLFAQRSLIVLSVDGLDHRYLRDAAKLNLKIPRMLKLAQQGRFANGVAGVVPTVTWPSHTTLITGKRPDEHGILGNRRPRSEGGDYYWTVDLLKSKTLWHAAHDAGMKTAAITWPVTVGASIDLNLPEAFAKRNGGGMDLATIRAKGTPGLVEKIIAYDKTFDQEFMDDRTRAIAAVYFLKHEKPNLLLLHFVDHDSVAHHNGPFTKEALEELERTDKYIGQILDAAPKNAVICLTADHGFERIDKMINLAPLKEKIVLVGGAAVAQTEAAATKLRGAAGVGREIPREEFHRFAPQIKDAVAVFDSAPHVQFVINPVVTETELPPYEKGNHGLWPGRADYRSVFVLSGAGVSRKALPEVDMLQIAGELSGVLGLKLN